MFGRKSTGERAVGRAAKKAGLAAKSAGRAEKNAGRAEKQAGRAVTRAARAEKRAERAGRKAEQARKNEPAGLLGALTNPKTAAKALAVAKIVGPAVAPLALRATTTARGFLDERRAIKLGVTPDQLNAYRGPTGPAGARIVALRSAIEEVRQRRNTDRQVTRFADMAKMRLVDLSTAVNTAGSMPAPRRRATLLAINKELNQIEADLMTYLVGTTT